MRFWVYRFKGFRSRAQVLVFKRKLKHGNPVALQIILTHRDSNIP